MSNRDLLEYAELALAGIVAATLSSSWDWEQRTAVLDAHIGIFDAFAGAVGGRFDLRQDYDPLASNGEVWVDGYLGRDFRFTRHCDGRLAVRVGLDPSDPADRGPFAELRHLWLPEDLQRIGLGSVLVEAFLAVWRAIGVVYVDAASDTTAGIAALRRWGFNEVSAEWYDPHVPFRLTLNRPDGREGTGSAASLSSMTRDLSPAPDPRRTFNRSERAVLGLLADWRCERCGRPLEPGWHADHRTAHSRGGDTDITNGQALCPACNLSKGVR